jgi:hypothetical protein
MHRIPYPIFPQHPHSKRRAMRTLPGWFWKLAKIGQYLPDEVDF